MAKRISERELEQRYCERLDEIYPECKIAGLTYSTSRALAEVDPTAFRCGFADWIDAEIGETIWELDGEYYDADPSDDGEE